MSDITTELGQLADLRDRGVLTQDEFDQQKARLLRSPSPDAALGVSEPSPKPVTSLELPVPAAVAAPVPVATPTPTQSAAPPLSGDEREQLLRAFVGRNADYYLGKWGHMAGANKGAGWNTAAFFLSIFWLFYRKMTTFGLIAAGAYLLVILISSLVHNGVVNLLVNGLELGMAVWIGFNGNRLYRARAEEALTEVQASTADPATRLAKMRTQGGVSMPLALGAAAAWVVAVIAITYAVLRISPAGIGPSGVASYSVPTTTSTSTLPIGGSAVGPVPTPTSVASAVVDDSWLVGQWENVAAPACAQWMRFGSDHSLGDNASGSGTWSLGHSADGSYVLSMNITGTGLREGPIEHDVGADTITMGSAPNTITWRKTTC